VCSLSFVFHYIKKIKTLLQHAKQALRGGTGIALPILNSASRKRRVVNTTSHLLYPQKSKLVSTVQEVGWAFGPVWKGLENLAPTGVQSLDIAAYTENCTDYAIPAIMFITYR
jgi:hypothetical protein